jgi:hypothetical protein
MNEGAAVVDEPARLLVDVWRDPAQNQAQARASRRGLAGVGLIPIKAEPVAEVQPAWLGTCFGDGAG